MKLESDEALMMKDAASNRTVAADINFCKPPLALTKPAKSFEATRAVIENFRKQLSELSTLPYDHIVPNKLRFAKTLLEEAQKGFHEDH